MRADPRQPILKIRTGFECDQFETSGDSKNICMTAMNFVARNLKTFGPTPSELGFVVLASSSIGWMELDSRQSELIRSTGGASCLLN